MFASLRRASTVLTPLRRPRTIELSSTSLLHQRCAVTTASPTQSVPVKPDALIPTSRPFSALSSPVEPDCCTIDGISLSKEEPTAFEKAKYAFEEAWARLEHRGMPLIFPREIIWLNGAPGSGKTANSKFIMKIRGFAHDPLVISELLQKNHPEVQRQISEGKLVDDKTVVEALLLELVKPVHRAGALVDGFPRTKEQVAILPLLCDKMMALNKAGEPGAPMPRFFVCILNVGREESKKRQLLRGQKAKQHNEKVRCTKTGEYVEERTTDFDEALIEKRYEIYLKHRDTVQTLHRMFHFKTIDTEQPIEAVQENIKREFAYQSERELDSATYESMGDVPEAGTLQNYARDALVQRLNTNRMRNSAEFKEAVDFVRARVIPACRMAAFAGVAQLRLSPEDPFHERFGVLSQLVSDVLAERGFRACVAALERDVPVRVLPDGTIEMKRRITHLLNVRFPAAKLRE